MSITHSILSALNLKDPHLHFSEDCVSSQSIRGVDSLVFSGSLSAIQNAKDAGFRTVAVQGSAGAADWSTMQQLATQSLAQYSELLADSV